MPKFLVRVEIDVSYVIEAASAEEAKAAVSKDVDEWDYLGDDIQDARRSAWIVASAAGDIAEIDMGVADGKTVAAYDWERMKKTAEEGSGR